MSEYQYYEFCRINQPLSKEARQKMHSLSSRAKVNSHSASYVYNYGDFRGKPKELLLNYFDVFFYISNFGTVQLIFKYTPKEINQDALKKYCIKHVIKVEQHDQNVLLDIYINNEEGFGWTEGEGILPELLPLYSQIKNGNYQFLDLVTAVNEQFTGGDQNTLKNFLGKNNLISEAEQAFLECFDIES
jgi:hypothetical protein